MRCWQDLGQAALPTRAVHLIAIAVSLAKTNIIDQFSPVVIFLAE